jgi:hypothetical protein
MAAATVHQRHTPPNSTIMPPSKHDSSRQKRLGNTTIVSLKRFFSLHPKQSLLVITTFIASIMYLRPAATNIISSKLLRLSTNTVPSCPSSPWKENEAIHGNCQGGGIKLNPLIKSSTECATTCCDDPKCITFQYRSDVGCFQGDDVRLGLEKDGAPTWCNDAPPVIWKGQYLVPRVQGADGKDIVYSDAERETFRKKSCDLTTWTPDERQGQCFGLGGKREAASASAEECMKACCADPNCGAWQWANDGCFYGKWMFGCLPGSSEAYVGRRKFQISRTYADGSGKPYRQDLSLYQK